MRPGPWGACVGASVHRWCAVRTRATKELPGELYACSGLGRERVAELSAGQVWSRSTRT